MSRKRNALLEVRSDPCNHEQRARVDEDEVEDQDEEPVVSAFDEDDDPEEGDVEVVGSEDDEIDASDELVGSDEVEELPSGHVGIVGALGYRAPEVSLGESSC